MFRMTRATVFTFFGLTLVVAVCSGDEVAEKRSADGDVNQGGYRESAIVRAIPLLRLKEIREEIDLTPEQIEGLTRSGDRNHQPELDRSEFARLTEDQKQQLARAHQSERFQWEKLTKADVEEVLLPIQIKRLIEISVQLRGLGALQDRAIAEELEITQQQRQRMMQQQFNFLKQLRNAVAEKANAPKSASSRLSQIREQMEGRVLAVLDLDQRARFEQMKGEPFEIPDRWSEPERCLKKSDVTRPRSLSRPA